MKKIINDPNEVVSDMLRGLVKANPELHYSEGLEVISKVKKSGNVGIITGGGSGHEPAHAGYVGEGMLDAAIAGHIFSSPSPDRILEGIHRADSGKGILMIIKNYSGDIMNFRMAAEIAGDDGIEIDHVIVKDDVAVPDTENSAGRRGIAGTVFIHKIAGAAALSGYDLANVKRVAQKAIDNVRTMGMAMTPCILPAVGKAGFEIGDNDMVVGMGIHGEPGIETKPIASSADLAVELVDKILADYDYAGKEVALLVNGMGGTPLMELFILNSDVTDYLQKKDVKIYRTFVGNYMTSLEMAGCSVTLLALDDELKKLLDMPCRTPGLTIV